MTACIVYIQEHEDLITVQDSSTCGHHKQTVDAIDPHGALCQFVMMDNG